MRLNTGIIAHYMPTKAEHICGFPDHQLVLSDIRFLLPGKDRYLDSFLYLTLWDELKNAEGNLPSYIVCVGGGSEAAAFFESAGLTGIICGDMEPVFLFDEIQSIFLKFTQLETNLRESLERKAPTREILNCCADFFYSHITVFDTERNLIDYSDHYMPGSDDLFWKETLETGRRAESLHRHSRDGVVQPVGISTPDSVLLDFGTGLPRMLAHTFYENRNRLGVLMVVEQKRPLSSYQVRLLDYICELLTQNLFMKYNPSTPLSENMRSIFMSIMDNNIIDPLTIKKLLGVYSWDLNDNYRLIRIKLPQELIDSAIMARYRYIYERIFPDCVAFEYFDSIVMMIHNDEREIMAECLPRLEKQLENHKAVCGISMPLNNLLQIKAHYNYAEAAITLGDQNKRIRYLWDVLLEYLIGRLASDLPIIPICHREVQRVYEYDRENGTELLLTLETYLKTNKSLKATAEALFIHRSTITYRLGCIDNMTKMNLDNPRERLHILLSCMALRVLDKVGAYKGM